MEQSHIVLHTLSLNLCLLYYSGVLLHGGFCENSESVNSEMRETVSFKKERLVTGFLQ